ncbi:hypothetical protein AALH30_22645 [Blautia pseudococcoides]|uniref:hypothetical protein n=1 Tax=Blautia pseudococcoides TaxID=1796616 RepID=UPI00351430F3
MKDSDVIKDLDTLQIRCDLIPELTDKQYSNLTLMALRAGLHNARELIQSFVADLTGWQRNGSDEEQFAYTWYDRAYCITTDFLMPWRYYVYNYDYDIEQLTEEPDRLKKAYEHYCEECKWGGVEPESWDEVLRVNQELLQEKKEDQEQLMQYIEAEKAEIK